jgi:hypothetical protein
LAPGAGLENAWRQRNFAMDFAIAKARIAQMKIQVSAKIGNVPKDTLRLNEHFFFKL